MNIDYCHPIRVFNKFTIFYVLPEFRIINGIYNILEQQNIDNRIHGQQHRTTNGQIVLYVCSPVDFDVRQSINSLHRTHFGETLTGFIGHTRHRSFNISSEY